VPTAVSVVQARTPWFSAVFTTSTLKTTVTSSLSGAVSGVPTQTVTSLATVAVLTDALAIYNTAVKTLELTRVAEVTFFALAVSVYRVTLGGTIATTVTGMWTHWPVTVRVRPAFIAETSLVGATVPVSRAADRQAWTADSLTVVTSPARLTDTSLLVALTMTGAQLVTAVAVVAIVTVALPVTTGQADSGSMNTPGK